MVLTAISVASLSSYRRQSKRVFVLCVKIFEMEQRAMNKFYFKSEKTAKKVYQDQKNLYGDDCVVHKSSDVSRAFKKAGNRWRMILAQAGQFPRGPMKMRRKLSQL